VAAKRIDRLSALTDQQLPDPEDHGCTLHIFALYRHKAHRGAYCCLANRFSIRSIILLTLDEGFDVSWRDQSHFVAQLANLTAPEMSTPAGLHRNDASRKLAEKRQNLRPPQLLAQNRSACAIGSMHPEYNLCQIEPDCDNIRHDRSPFCGSLQTHLGTSMPSGGGYIIRAI